MKQKSFWKPQRKPLHGAYETEIIIKTTAKTASLAYETEILLKSTTETAS
jgi:hypothetical protein